MTANARMVSASACLEKVSWAQFILLFRTRLQAMLKVLNRFQTQAAKIVNTVE